MGIEEIETEFLTKALPDIEIIRFHLQSTTI